MSNLPDTDTYLGNALRHLATRQRAWSEKTFGTSEERGSEGPLKHLAKEVMCELLDLTQEGWQLLTNGGTPLSLRPDASRTEYADCLILLLDACWRDGVSVGHLVTMANDKMTVNAARKWPKPTPGQPVEHLEE